MKKIILLLAFLSLSNCAGLTFLTRGVPLGFFYVDTHMNERATENAIRPEKTGEACARSILGIIVTGDASAAKAMEAKKITKVAIVDQKYSNILGILADYCIIVHGE